MSRECRSDFKKLTKPSQVNFYKFNQVGNGRCTILFKIYLTKRIVKLHKTTKNIRNHSDFNKIKPIHVRKLNSILREKQKEYKLEKLENHKTYL